MLSASGLSKVGQRSCWQALQELVVFRSNDQGQAKTVQYRQKFVGANTSGAVLETREQVYRDADQRRRIVNTQPLLLAMRSHLPANVGQLANSLHGRQRR